MINGRTGVGSETSQGRSGGTVPKGVTDHAMHLEVLQELALRLSGERSVDAVLQLLVDGLAQQSDVALARVWVTGPGDVCSSCRMRPVCPNQTVCLHLSASAGTSLEGEQWPRIDGYFSRVPIGQFKVGSIAADRTGLLLTDPRSEQWARPEWVRHESIACFAGQPLVFRDEMLGVLGVFRRAPIAEQEFGWLLMFANQAASAIANARAFSELDRLRQQLESHNAYLKEEVDSVLNFGSIVGRSSALRDVLQQVDDVAATDATVLITGESGTGKELLAKEIHERGRRSRRPFIRVNCSAIPREMFESEFFGHVRGAFTGALRDRPGRFQVADGGTIFLDEIGDLPLDLQPKLLRVLQEGEYERVGEDVTRKVDVRVIAATNQNLAEQVHARRFRQDLFYRLNVFPLELPPLRTRKSDIPLLATHTIAEVSKRLGTSAPPLTQEDAACLQQYRVARQCPRAAERHRAGRHSVERRAPSSRCCAAGCTWRHRLRQLTFRRRPRRCHSHRPRVPRSRADESDEGARACRWPDLWSRRRGRIAWGQSNDSRLTSARAQDQDEQDALIPGRAPSGRPLGRPWRHEIPP